MFIPPYLRRWTGIAHRLLNHPSTRNQMLKEGDPAPDFELRADDGSTVKLSGLRGKRVILFFYPKADTSGCTIEACEFRDTLPKIAAEDAVVLGVSPDPITELVNFRDKYGLNFRLLGDQDHRVAERYGVWREKSMYGRVYLGVERTTFVIGEDSRISRVYERVKPKGHAAAVLADLEGR